MKVDLTKATPRPWRKDKRQEALIGANGVPVIVWGVGIGYGQRNPETEANGYLFVAAVNAFDAARELAKLICEAAWKDSEGKTPWVPKAREWLAIEAKAHEVLRLMGADNETNQT